MYQFTKANFFTFCKLGVQDGYCYGINDWFKGCNGRVYKIPGILLGRPENSGKIPVSWEAQNQGKSTPGPPDGSSQMVTFRCFSGKLTKLGKAE